MQRKLQREIKLPKITELKKQEKREIFKNRNSIKKRNPIV